MKRIAGVLIVAALLALGFTLVLAQSDEIISSCVHFRSGNIRIVDSVEECRTPEYPLTWNTGSSTSESMNFYTNSITTTVVGGEINSNGQERRRWPAVVSCETGDEATGGGYFIPEHPPSVRAFVEQNHPEGEASWRVQLFNANTDLTYDFVVYVRCASIE